jgi:transposase-like protein
MPMKRFELLSLWLLRSCRECFGIVGLLFTLSFISCADGMAHPIRWWRVHRKRLGNNPRFKCTECQRKYVLNSPYVIHTKEERSTAFRLYVEGHRISDIARRLGACCAAVRKWIKAEAHQTPDSQSVLLRMMKIKIERECPYCQQVTTHSKAGFVAGTRNPRFKCKQCRQAYTPNRSRGGRTKEERSTAFQLYTEGHRISDIARRLGASETAVREWIKAHQASELVSV